MKKITLVSLMLLLAAGSVLAQSPDVSIYELRTGAVVEGTIVQCDGIVTVVRYNGFSLQEPGQVSFGGIWVYTSTTPTVVPGDMIAIDAAEYKEYYDLSELDVASAGGIVSVISTGNPVPVYSTHNANLQANAEEYESLLVEVTDGFVITELLGYGEWNAVSKDDASVLLHDDYFFDDSVLAVGDCYQGVTGMWTYSFGAFKMEPLEDGLLVEDCAVDNEEASFGSLKAMYR